MSRRITAGNDAPFRWAVKLQGKPFDLSGKDVKVYVINSRGEIPVAQLTIEGHEVSGVFEGRYQTRLGEHSLVLRVNEGRPEMKTATVANVFKLVQWSADAGGSDEGDVIVAPVLIESELSIGGGSSYDDSEVKNELARLEREKADKSELTELSAEVSELSERVDELGEGGSNLFEAVYGETTHNEIVAAANKKKHIICFYKNRIYNLTRYNPLDDLVFTCADEEVLKVTCKVSGGWSDSLFDYEHKFNKTKTISESSTDAQYPSAKAVYDFVQQSGGQGGRFAEVMEQSASPIFTINSDNYDCNTIVRCGVLSSLTISSISALPLEVNIRFSTGESVDDFLNIPADAKKVGDVTCEASCEYVMSILDGVIILGKIE